jgi:hypothetical protein
MKVKNVKLEYYVLRHDFNENKIVRYNVFYTSWPEEIRKKIKSNKIQSRDDLKDWLSKEFKYHYWCKSEHEIAVGSLFSKSQDDLEKIDIWYQIELNIDMITDYVISKMEIQFRR